MTGHEIHDPERHLGVTLDFLVDEGTWKIAFLVGRRFGHSREEEFLVPSDAVSQISFAGRRVAIREESHWNLVFQEREGYGRRQESLNSI